MSRSVEEPAPRPRANVYIDGFNLYHGCFGDKKNEFKRSHWRHYRWLDLGVFCEKFYPRYSINRIRYFTALVEPFPENPNNQARQQAYLRALETIPCLTIHRGRFALNEKKRLLAVHGSRPPVPRIPLTWESVIEREEKGSDVNLASYLLLDGFRGDYETAIVITNDSDLAEPIRLVRRELRRRVEITNPRKKVAYDLKGIADFYREIREWVLRESQFPETLADAEGRIIRKPSKW